MKHGTEPTVVAGNCTAAGTVVGALIHVTKGGRLAEYPCGWNVDCIVAVWLTAAPSKFTGANECAVTAAGIGAIITFCQAGKWEADEAEWDCIGA